MAAKTRFRTVHVERNLGGKFLGRWKRMVAS
jgi:hypothetical protein